MIPNTRKNRNIGLIVLAAVCLLATGILTGRLPVTRGQTSSDEPSKAENLQQKDRSELQKILRSKLKRLNDLQTQTFEARQDMNRNIQQAASGRDRLQQEVKQAKQRLSEKKSKLKQLRQKSEDLKEKKRAVVAALDQLDASADRLKDELTSHIQQTIPYQRKKRRSALSSNSSSDQTPDPASRLRSLTDAARNELTDGTTSELVHRRVPLSSSDSPRKKHARLVRIGQNTLFYVTEDGKQAGYYVWKNDQWQVKRASSDQARRFRHAIDVLRGQRQPERVPLPVILPSRNP